MEDTEIIEGIRALIADKRQQRAAVAETLAELDDAIKSFERAEAALNPKASVARTQETTEVALRRIMKERETTATLMDLVAATGRQKNAVRNAVAKLVESGFLEKTGNLIGRSPEYALTAEAAAE